MTVDEVLDRMSSRELAEWMAFHDYRMAPKPRKVAASHGDKALALFDAVTGRGR